MSVVADGVSAKQGHACSLALTLAPHAHRKLRLDLRDPCARPSHEEKAEQEPEKGTLQHQSCQGGSRTLPRLNGRIHQLGTVAWPGLHGSKLFDLTRQELVAGGVDV